MNRRNTPYTVEEAAKESPTLAKLLNLSRVSTAWLHEVQPLLPANLRSAILAGPIDTTVWCLIVNGNAVAAKLRQFVPMLLIHLQSAGHDITAIRLKVQIPPKSR